MVRSRRVRISLVTMTCLLMAPAAWAQQASAIAGVVRDASGGVLPGVTVEAASPALIEKIRTVVSDAEGRYNIVDLRPGTYSVTFTLPGFNTFRRDGIVLTAGFTATVNAEMPVGALEETITVTGEAPLVDTQNARQQTVLSSDLLAVLPSGQKGHLTSVVTLTPGVTGGTPDVGGTAGLWVSQVGSGGVKYHGRVGLNITYDGLSVLGTSGTGAGLVTGYQVNSLMVQEMVVEKGGGSAESGHSGLTTNMVPREGGNTHNFSVEGMYSNGGMQGNNLNDALRARGITALSKVDYVYNAGITAGGPIRQDRVWFFSGYRRQGNHNYEANNYYNKNFGTPQWYRYEPDFTRQADQLDFYNFSAGRLTWQASPRNKFSFAGELQHMREFRRTGNDSPEAKVRYHHFPTGILQGSWTSPVSNRFLLEAGMSQMFFNYPTFPQDGVTSNTIGIQELSTGYVYNAKLAGPLAFDTPTRGDRWGQRFSASYVTGSHAFKVGLQVDELLTDRGIGMNIGSTNRSYAFNLGVPVRITQHAVPYLFQVRGRDVGLYAQDRWTIKRLTLNYGVRLDHFNGWVPEQDIAATEFVPARHYAAARDVPLWTDVSPRLGVSYDLFGTGKTALKLVVGRYVKQQPAAIATANNPITASVSSANRTWTDANGDYHPDCDLRNFAANGECGLISDTGFGQVRVTTRYADDVREGWNARESTWDLSTEVQHEVTAGMSLTAGYYRTMFSHGATNYVTDNLLVTPADYDHFCVTAPRDSRLPAGGGYQVCGLYDIKPEKFALSDNLVRQPFDFGDPQRVSDYFNVSINTRFASGLLITGGVDTGRELEDNCFVVDSPQALLNCRVETPWKSKTQVKLQGSYPLPRGFSVSAVFQNVAGPSYVANFTATNAQIAPSLGRNLAMCGTRLVGCTATFPVPLLPPETHYEKRMTQLDLRLSKIIRLGDLRRLQANLDLYNALNANSLLNVNSNFGPRWRQTTGSQPTLPARLLQFSGRLTF